MTFIPDNNNIVDTNNSTTSPLGVSGVFTGTSTDVSTYNTISFNFFADVASSTKGIEVQFSSDNTNWFTYVEYDTIGGSVLLKQSPVIAQYFRLVYTNGTTGQTTFRVQTILLVSPRTQEITGNVAATIKEPLSAFGEILSVQPYPVAQILFTYGQNINTSTVSTANGGTTSVTNGQISLISGTTSGGSAQVISKKNLIYRTGQGSLARFTAIFTTGVANTQQIAGFGNTTDGLFFGYNGATFGILHRNNSVDTWIPQTSWNFDTMDGSGTPANPSNILLDQTKGNVYQIKYQFLGYGAISFFIEDFYTGLFIRVHNIQYTNTNTVTNLRNPSFPLLYRADYTSGGQSVTLQTSSGGLFVEGVPRFLGAKYGFDNNKSPVSTTLTNIFSLQNRTTINSITNRAQIRIRNISGACANSGGGSTTVGTVRVIFGATLGGAPSFTNVDTTNSIAATDIDGTTVTGGVVKFNASISSTGNFVLDVTDMDISILPGELLTFAFIATANATISISCTWSEEL